MDLTKIAGLIAIVFAALFIFAAYPAYSAVLGPDAPTRWEASRISLQAEPTESPVDPAKNNKVKARDDQATTLMNIAVAIDVLANDDGVDRENSSLSIISVPGNGSVLIQLGGTILYTPSTGFTGEDRFEYEVCNDESSNPGKGKGNNKNCDKARVRVIVDPTPIPNEQPTAVNDLYSVEQGEQLSVAAPGVLANDSDPNGDALTAILVRSAENGSLAFNANGSFLYSPEEGFTGVDTFTYRASDGEYESNLGTVEIEVIDTEPPTVRWLSPVSDGGVLDVGYEMVRLEVEAWDNGSIDKVRFFRWDAEGEVFVDIAEVTQPPYAVEFHASVLNYEWNQILARVYDSAGNVSERIYIWIFQTVNGTKVFLPSVTR
jgi:hypothetical protein